MRSPRCSGWPVWARLYRTPWSTRSVWCRTRGGFAQPACPWTRRASPKATVSASGVHRGWPERCSKDRPNLQLPSPTIDASQSKPHARRRGSERIFVRQPTPRDPRSTSSSRAINRQAQYAMWQKQWRTRRVGCDLWTGCWYRADCFEGQLSIAMQVCAGRSCEDVVLAIGLEPTAQVKALRGRLFGS